LKPIQALNIFVLYSFHSLTHSKGFNSYYRFKDKGKRKLNHLGWSDVLRHKRVRGGYPTEKPVSLLKDLIENSSNEGEVVMDMFAGSGSTLEAALGLNRYAIGADVQASALNTTRARLSAYTEDSELHVPRKQLSLVNF